jgi:acetolactate synthase-1/3 small subunit
VAGLFSARGYNIESLSVGETLDPTVSRMTLVVHGDAFVIEQVIKQLHKLVDVIKVTDLSEEDHVEREMILVKVNAEPAARAEILRIGDIFRAKVVDVTPTTYTLEATGEESKIDAIIELLRPFGIQELVRTGKVAIARGPKTRLRKVAEKPSAPREAGRAQSDDPKVVGFAD